MSTPPHPVYSVTESSTIFPELPGVYCIWCNHGNNNPVDWSTPSYVGQTINFRKRALQHRYSPSRMFTDAAMMTFTHVPSPDARIAMEKWLINRYQPPYNHHGRIPLRKRNKRDLSPSQKA